MSLLLITVSCGILLQLGPIKTYKQHAVDGLFVCSEPTNGNIEVKLPPVQGQFMARNRDVILEHFDFDLRPEQKGAWLWKSTIQKDTRTVISIPASTLLPVILSSASAQTGTQTAEIQYITIQNPATVSYTCNGKTLQTKNGVGSCVALSRAHSVVTATTSDAAIIRHTGCDEAVAPSTEFELAADCTHGVRVLTAAGATEARIVYRVKRGDVGLLPRPSRVDGKWIKPWQAAVWQDEGACAYAWNEGSFSWGCL